MPDITTETHHQDQAIGLWKKCATRAFLHDAVAALAADPDEEFGPVDEIMLTWVHDSETGKRVHLFGEYAPQSLDGFRAIYPQRMQSEADPNKTIALGSLVGNRLAVVKGGRFRPDVATIVFAENGNLYLNTWAEPVHAPSKGHTIRPFLDLLEQVFPDETECTRFLTAFAYKVQNPGSRPNAMLSISPQVVDEDGHVTGDGGAQGTGRGALFELIGKLYPDHHSMPNYAALSGQNYQSQYSEFREGALFVMVDEIRDSSAEHIYRASARASTYEVIKPLIEKRAVSRVHNRKGVANVARAYDYFWLLMATNHVDPMAIDPEDRRIEVTTSGEPRPRGFWIKLQQHLDKPVFISAVWEYLKAFDASAYDIAEHAPVSPAKARLYAVTTSDLDELVEQAMAELLPEVFATRQRIMAVARSVAVEHHADNMADVIKRGVFKRSAGPTNKNGQINVEGRPVRAHKIGAAYWTVDDNDAARLVLAVKPRTKPF